MAQTDRNALVALYNATGGAEWKNNKNWNTDAALSQWYGVKANSQDRVVKLLLGNNKLRGPIPPELGKLTALKELYLTENQLTGPIRPELGNLSNLQKLDLRGPLLGRGRLTGPIPSELGHLSALKELDLCGNQLSGSIPKELGALRALRDLRLYSNQLSGTIPKELGKLTALQELRLFDNHLSGPIPEELGKLTAVKVLFLSGNKLSGHIPRQLGELSALETLDLSYNKLEGRIPEELGKLTALQVLTLDNNQLSGHIPPELGNLSALRELYLYDNQLSALWDHSRDVVPGEELLQGCAVGFSIPKELEILLALLTRLSSTAGCLLQLTDNLWEEPPEPVLKKGMRAVSNYFADVFAEGITTRRSMIKVVLVGQEGAGKTSLRQSMRTGQPTPTSGPDESTVQIDVEEMNVDGASLRVYDCAGQVAYTGLLQMFLSPRAVSLLVCNIGAFGQRDGCSSDRDQLNGDLAKLREMRVCDWLRSLSFRIPDSDVIIVATKCDQAGGNSAELARRMERAVRKWLEHWSNANMPAVRVEGGVSLTSCVATEEEGDAASRERKHARETMWACDWCEDVSDESTPSLVRRVMYSSEGNLRGAAMVLPRSWNIALAVLEALGSGRDALESVHQMLLRAGEPEAWKRAASTTTKHEGMEGITRVELLAKWHGVVDALKRDGVTVNNPGHALEEALTIREHQGSLVRHETYVFLDVTWLAKILKPLLNHRDDEDPFCGSLSLGDTGIMLEDEEHIASWKRLRDEGVLEPALAEVLWPDGLSDYVVPTLDSLGLTHPLDGDAADGLVVLLRRGMERPEGVGKELDDFRRDHIAVLSVRWKIFMGVPPGAIEKVLTRCCRIGALRTFWRFGVLVQGGFGAATTGKTFALLMEYSHDTNEIDMKVYGNIGTAAPWAALSLGISALRTMCLEFPGLRWRASLQCPQHEQDMHISSKATGPGDKLLLEKTCSLCSSETGGLGAAATELLEMNDVVQSKDELFRATNVRFIKLQDKYPVLRPEASRDIHPEQVQRRLDECFSSVRKELKGLRHFVKESSDEGSKLQRVVGDLEQHLGQQHQDVRQRLGALGDKFERLADVIDADDGVMGSLDFVVTMMMAMRKEGSDTPRHACILPPWKFAETHGLSEDEQTPEVWIKRLEEWQEDDFREGKMFFKKKKRLFLVCAHTYRLVPCGPNGQGYDIQQPRTWFSKSAKVATFALQVASTTLSTMAMVPLSGANAAVGAAVEATVVAAAGTFEAMLQDRLARLGLDNGGADMDVAPQAARLEGGVYASLREFIHGVEDIARVEIGKARKKAHRNRRAPPSPSEFVFFAQEMAQVQSRDGDATVQWVLKRQEEAWYGANRRAPMA